MGHSREQKTKTHERIVALASKRFRETGLAGIGIAELMKEAVSLSAASTNTSAHGTIWWPKHYIPGSNVEG